MLKDSSSTNSPYPWSIPVGIFIALATVLILQPLIGIVISLFTSAIGWSATRADAWLATPLITFLTYFAAEALAVVFVYMFVKLKKGNYFQIVGFRKPCWKDLSYALVGFLIYLGVAGIILTVVSGYLGVNSNDKQNIGFNQGIGGSALVLAFISLVILPPIVEEITFRGFLYGTLRSHKTRVGVAVLATSLIFGALHLFTGTGTTLLWTAGIDTFVLSTVLCNLRERTGGIWASMLVHSLKNCLVFITLFIITSP